MTCAQGLLRLLWGGPEVGVLRDCSKATYIAHDNSEQSAVVQSDKRLAD